MFVAFAVLEVGCGKILGIEDTSFGGDDDVAIDASVSTDAPSAIDAAPPDAGFVCADDTFDPAVGMKDLNNETAADDVALSCGDSSSLDVLFGWTAPVTDYYVFDTFGSEFDTVVGLLDGCGGTELACNQNAGTSAQSEIVRKFEAGQSALVVVDGFAGDSGNGTLSVSRVDCPDLDLEGLTFPLTLSTAGFGDDFAGACGGAGNDDRAYHFVPEVDGLYRIRAVSDVFRPTVNLFLGPRCGGPSLGCNASGTLGAGAEVVRRLLAGEVVGIEVDGVNGQGTYDIDIALQDGPACPETQLPVGTGLPGETLTERSLAPSCGFASNEGPFGGIEELPDHTYRVDVDSVGVGCFGDVVVTVTAAEPHLLYALDQGDCGGREIGCVQATGGGGVFTAQLGLPASQTENLSYTVVVARSVPDIGDSTYEISSEVVIACAAE